MGKEDPIALRRRIGYVIQQVGLFPHMTVEANISVLPGLLGRDKARTKDRVPEAHVWLESGERIGRGAVLCWVFILF